MLLDNMVSVVVFKRILLFVSSGGALKMEIVSAEQYPFQIRSIYLFTSIDTTAVHNSR
jgi:hypothetical protein